MPTAQHRRDLLLSWSIPKDLAASHTVRNVVMPTKSRSPLVHWQVPPLILQPLVENAVLHAVAPRREGGRVKVGATRKGSILELTVEDDGPGLGNSTHHGSGTSLVDLGQRLDLLYGERARIERVSPESGGCRVTLTLPLETES